MMENTHSTYCTLEHWISISQVHDNVNDLLIYMIFQILEGKFSQELSHEIDGLIFQPPDVRFFYVICHIVKHRSSSVIVTLVIEPWTPTLLWMKLWKPFSLGPFCWISTLMWCNTVCLSCNIDYICTVTVNLFIVTQNKFRDKTRKNFPFF
jgi:hypothetical protein